MITFIERTTKDELYKENRFYLIFKWTSIMYRGRQEINEKEIIDRETDIIHMYTIILSKVIQLSSTVRSIEN